MSSEMREYLIERFFKLKEIRQDFLDGRIFFLKLMEQYEAIVDEVLETLDKDERLQKG